MIRGAAQLMAIAIIIPISIKAGGGGGEVIFSAKVVDQCALTATLAPDAKKFPPRPKATIG